KKAERDWPSDDGYAFSPCRAFKKKSQFEQVFEQGRKIRTEYFTIFFRKAKQKQVGIIVTKKHGNAVYRNRVKRLVRELYRTNKEALHCDGQMIILPSARKDWRSAPYSLLQDDWLRAAEKLNNLC
ncbi:MAG TPA: ribonuclease P protein component, partial [Candidatus Mcinerneyibacteriales bacterium]|nr:ribonuclease P protein component [Candidatus Mcinerneyibacteriales bacterium]